MSEAPAAPSSMPEEDGLADLLATFHAESEENLAAIEQGVLRLEASPDDDDLLRGIFRAAHTLKGNASALGVDEVATFAHTVEEQLDRLRARKLTASPALVTVLLASVDALRGMLRVAANASNAEGGAAGAREVARRTLRVDVDKLDALLGAVTEIAVARARTERILEEMGPAGEAALDAHRGADRLHHTLQHLVLATRMVPLEGVFQVAARALRDVARAQGKLVRLEASGGDLEVDTRVAERLRDPLVHMLRNAVDHGVEAPEARRAAGKSASGTVRIVAAHAGGRLELRMTDDGRGLDRSKILRRAREVGLVGPGAAPAPDAIDELVFAPGFSTADEVTATSGRGVGMDVVRRNLEEIGGEVRVESVQGTGTTFVLAVPLTIAIIDGLITTVGDDVYVVPMTSVVGCVELATSDARPEDQLIVHQGSALPCIGLRRFLGVNGAPASRACAVVVQHEGRRAGLIVDAVLDQKPTVVKPLGRLFHRVPGVAAGAVWSDGRIALILDVPTLLRRMRRGEGRAA